LSFIESDRSEIQMMALADLAVSWLPPPPPPPGMPGWGDLGRELSLRKGWSWRGPGSRPGMGKEGVRVESGRAIA
jgi:hypothetical protein